MASNLEKLEFGVAWAEFCDQLKAVGAQISIPDVPDDALTRAEGYRYFTLYPTRPRRLATTIQITIIKTAP